MSSASLRQSFGFYRRAMSYFKQDWPLVVGWIVLIVLTTGVGLLSAWPMAILIDSVLASAVKTDWLHRLMLAPLPADKIGRIVGLAVIGLFLKVLGDALGTVQSVLSNQINYSGLMRIRCDLFRKLQALSLAYHQSQPQGDAIYRLSNDTLGCQNILNLFVSTLAAGLTLVVMTFVLASRNLSLTAMAFSIAPFLAWTNFIFADRFNRRTLDCRQIDSKFMTCVQRSMGAIRLVQAFAREEEEFGQFQGTIQETIRAWWRLNREQLAYNLIVGALFGIGGAAIFGYGGYLVCRNRLSVGELLVFTSYLGMLWNPLCQMTGFSASAQSGVASTARVFEILDRQVEIADLPNAVRLPPRLRRLELDAITFGYDSTRPVLRDLSLTIEPGQMVCFVGSSGVGKSTLLNLLPRFYDPLAGSIRLDGVDLRSLRVKDLRRNVALVMQDSVILPTTIAENIAYGRPGATRQQIIHAAELAGAAGFIQSLNNGLNTIVAEGGGNLSGGQRQRIAIARALLTEAPFIVLDEPTSALDPHHERLICDLLASLKGPRTIILVTHRLSTAAACDQIYVMHDGRVAQKGTHAQLMLEPGLFREMATKAGTPDTQARAA